MLGAGRGGKLENRSASVSSPLASPGFTELPPEFATKRDGNFSNLDTTSATSLSHTNLDCST